MNYWFECKVSYERQADSMGMKKVSESYLVDALSFTEAEARIIKEVTPFVSVGELEVVNIRRARIAELFLSENPEHERFYRAKVNFITIDEVDLSTVEEDRCHDDRTVGCTTERCYRTRGTARRADGCL